MDTTTARVLVIEDSSDEFALVDQSLGQSATPRFETRPVSSLREGLKLLGEGFDAVVLDFELPESGGLAAVQQVLEAAPPTPLVVVSGSADAATGRRCIHAGANAFLSKDSLRPESLCAAVRGAIERGRPEAS